MEKKKKKGNIGYCIALVLALLFTIGAATFRFTFSKKEIVGTSMEPTLKEGQIGYVNHSSWAKSHVKRLDIVVLEVEEDYEIIKRVIALPGETIQIASNGDITITNEEGSFVLDQSFLQENQKSYTCSNKGYAPHACGKPYQIPEDSYFVLGDHRSVSLDSESKYGAIEKSKLVGVWAF